MKATIPHSQLLSVLFAASTLVGGLALSGCQQTTAGATTQSLTGTSSNGSSGGSGNTATNTTRIALLPSGASVPLGATQNFAASGGTAPYFYSVIGSGTINSAGRYTAPSFVTTDLVRVIDVTGNRLSVTINVVIPQPITPNDPLFSQQWSLKNGGGNGGVANADIGATRAWAFAQDCTGVPVAVIDTGIDSNHPDLASNVDTARGYNFVANNSNAIDDNLHGTHVAGIIGAIGNNSRGVSGVCWKAKLIPLKFLDANGDGTISDAIRAVDYARAQGAKVLNNSWSGGGFSQLLKDAIDSANTAGIIFVAASGNRAYTSGDAGYATEVIDNDVQPEYPGSYASANIISVAATTNRDQLADFSHYGSTSVHLAAPGENILSTFPFTATAEMRSLGKTSAYESISGTSMATPVVSGSLALLMATQPSLTSAQARQRLLDRADVLTALNGKVQGSRRLNVYNALNPSY